MPVERELLLRDRGEVLAPSSRGDSRGKFVYNALIEGIRSCRILPGDRIREEDVAQSLGVSRTPVREAFQHLQARGLIEMAPGRGIVVVELNTHQVMELYAMREVLEGAAAGLAAQHALPAEISMMHQFLDDFDAAEGDPPRLTHANNALHRTIYQAARNRDMQEALKNLEDRLALLQNKMFSFPERHAVASREHRAIVAAIESRDREGAEAASRLHIREAQRMRLQIINAANGSYTRG